MDVIADWPREFKRSRTLMANPKARAIREGDARERWVHALRDEVMAAKLPYTAVLATSQNPLAIMSIVAQGHRVHTLRRRVLDWRAAARYFFHAFASPWPRSIADMPDYLATFVADAKGRPALCRAVFALGFMEKAGGVLEHDRVSNSPLLKAALEELTLQLTGGVARPVRKAPQVPVALLFAFEKVVVDVNELPFVRTFAWWRLVRAWGSLRFDDHRGLLPSSLRLAMGSLRGGPCPH